MVQQAAARFDALLPPEMASRAEQLGVKKAAMDRACVFALAGLAGAFIALGTMFSTTVVAGTVGTLPYGVTRLLAGLAFSLELILVVVGGAELFTGNNLIVMAWADGKVSSTALLSNWGLVYLGNFLGALVTAALVYLSGQYARRNSCPGHQAVPTRLLTVYPASRCRLPARATLWVRRPAHDARYPGSQSLAPAGRCRRRRGAAPGPGCGRRLMMTRRLRWWLRIGSAVVLLGVVLLAVAPAAARAPLPPITDWPPDPPWPPGDIFLPSAPDVPPGVPPVSPLDGLLARFVPELPPGPVPPHDGVLG